MKNYINYYYNFNIYDIYFRYQKYFFKNGNNNYLLKQCFNKDIELYYNDLNKEIINRNYSYFLTIIPNRNKNLITIIDNKPYILLKLTNIYNDSISIFDIKNNLYTNYNNGLSILNHFPWTTLWANKIDYFENWYEKKLNYYKDLNPIFNYFIGISENALLYLKETEKAEIKEKSDNLTLQHNRLDINNTLFDYYDPTELIIDHSSRDISEYIKSCFINGIWDIELFEKYLSNHYFSRYGLRVMYARILFPSFFYDYVDNYVIKKNENDFKYIESKISEYNLFLKQISILFNEKYNIPIIPWIKKN